MTAPTPETPTPPAATVPETPPAATAPPATPDPTAPPAAKTPKKSLEDNLAGLDDDAKNFVLGEVEKARTEARNLRDRAKTADSAAADVLSKVAKALGIEEAAPDPVDLAKKLSDSTTESADLRRQVAVYAAAGKQYEASVLLDSKSFLTSIASIDPADSAAIAAAMEAAAMVNPAVRTPPPSRLPAPTAAPGSSGGGAPDAEAVKAEALRKGDWKTAIAIENQKLVTAPRP